MSGTPSAATLTRLWSEAFDATFVITTTGNDSRLRRLQASMPFDARIASVDCCAPGYDCLARRPEANHHVAVGNRHKAIVREAMRRHLDNVFVFEDDAEFTGGGETTLATVLRWARDHRDRWDVFYMGYSAPLLSRCSFVAPHVVRPSRPFQAHAIAYSRRVFDRILSIDFTGDHRPAVFRAIEAVTGSRARQQRYFAEGVGSLDSWLSFSGVRRHAAHPILVVQTAPPPGTEAGWERRTGRPYDYHRTPREQATIALAVHYSLVAAGITAAAAGAAWLVRRLVRNLT